MMEKLFETVPNFSEGKDPSKIEAILDVFRTQRGVKLIDHEADPDHNRCVVTAVGEPESLKEAVLAAVGVAVRLIDLRVHKGQHPRMGAVDVIPFIPLGKATMEEAISLSREVGRAVAQTYQIPVFLYEESASDPDRKNLADIRKGQFEAMAEKLKLPGWKPDFGGTVPHPSAGVVAIGARMPLVAFNVNLNTDDMEIANAIARAVRHQSGGLRFCKAIGVDLKARGIVQVSMNMTDFTRTPLHRAVELIRAEARRYGVSIAGSEIVGMVPMAALAEAAAYYMGLEHFSIEQVLEQRLAK
jgi:glutamate formiminotransferase / 5-formyltetrahydrofolate cyclo-ligase